MNFPNCVFFLKVLNSWESRGKAFPVVLFLVLENKEFKNIFSPRDPLDLELRPAD